MKFTIRQKAAGVVCLLALFLLAACDLGTDSVTGSPTISVSKIESVLAGAGSPAAGTGQSLYDLSVQYNIDAAVALAFFKHESGYGLHGVARVTLSLGNLRCKPDYECYDGYAKFVSWQQGYEAWYKLISGGSYVGSGKSTIATIIPTYAPSDDHNDEQSFIDDVNQTVQQYRS